MALIGELAGSPDSPAVEVAPGEAIRRDLALIADMVEPASRVLDIGCGDGMLLAHLTRNKAVEGCGMELSQAGVNACVRSGLSVIQGDADHDLAAYPDKGFDYVILSRTLQATRNPRSVLESLARIGKHAIVSFPNFGYWRIRLELLFKGRMPQSAMLSNAWYDTPNIHLCTVGDFLALARELDLVIERSVMLDRIGRPYRLNPTGPAANLLAEQAVFLLRRRQPSDRR